MKKVNITVLVLLVFSILFLPALAEAHGGQGGGHGGGHAGGHHGPGKAHGGFHRGFHGGGDGGFHSRLHGGGYGGFYVEPPVYGPYQMCYELIPEHWETQWDPKAKGYVNVFVPDHFVAIPCQ